MNRNNPEVERKISDQLHVMAPQQRAAPPCPPEAKPYRVTLDDLTPEGANVMAGALSMCVEITPTESVISFVARFLESRRKSVLKGELLWTLTDQAVAKIQGGNS